MTELKCLTCIHENLYECIYFGGNIISMGEAGIVFDHCNMYQKYINNKEE